MVKDIEELSSETERHLFADVKLALQPNIRLRSSETPQHIAPKIALLSLRRFAKSRTVKNFAARILRAIELERHSGVYVRARIQYVPAAKKIAPVRLSGGADLAKTKASSDQPPSAAWATLFDCGEGRS